VPGVRDLAQDRLQAVTHVSRLDSESVVPVEGLEPPTYRLQGIRSGVKSAAIARSKHIHHSARRRKSRGTATETLLSVLGYWLLVLRFTSYSMKIVSLACEHTQGHLLGKTATEAQSVWSCTTTPHLLLEPRLHLYAPPKQDCIGQAT
jgi:hypothetical protein